MLSCAIIGMGKIGKIRACEINAHPKTALKAVYDIDPAMTRGYDGASEVANAEDIFQMDDIDAVFVCTYNKYAPELTIKALEAGKHVFCEKPPARSSNELKEVMQAEQSSLKVLKYGFNHRYHHSVMEAKRLVENGMVGKLLWMRGVYGKAGGNKFAENWRNNKEESGGGILLDQGVHMLDLMRYFAGEFVEVKSMVQTKYWDIAVEDNAFALMKTEKDVIASIHSSATQWRHKFMLEMSFENGYINLDGILSGTRSYGDETLVIAKRQFEDETFAVGKPREEKIYFDTDDSWKMEMEEFVNCIESNLPVVNGSSQDAFRTLELVENIYRASGFYEERNR